MINYKKTIPALAKMAREMSEIKENFEIRREFAMRKQAFAIIEQIYALMYTVEDYATKKGEE